MNLSLPQEMFDQIALEEAHFTEAPRAFLEAWKRGVQIAATQWFGDGTEEGLQRATTKWDLRPNLLMLNDALGVLSSGQRMFLSAMVSFYNAPERGAMLRRCGFEGLSDLAVSTCSAAGSSPTCCCTTTAGERSRHRQHPLPSARAYLPDDAVERRVCLYCKNFALIDEDQEVPFDLRMHLQGDGYVCAVVYAVTATESDRSLRVGDTCSEEAAHEVVRRLRFETGVYSRCWEISSAHLSVQAHRFLAELVDVATPSGFLFVAFRIPNSRAIGVKLIGTPWTDSNPQSVHGITAGSCGKSSAAKACPSPWRKCSIWRTGQRAHTDLRS